MLLGRQIANRGIAWILARKTQRAMEEFFASACEIRNELSPVNS